MAESFRVTEDSTQMPFRGFLSDSAAGGFAAIRYGSVLPATLQRKPLKAIVASGVGQEDQTIRKGAVIHFSDVDRLCCRRDELGYPRQMLTGV
jgi:hypothetical protein